MCCGLLRSLAFIIRTKCSCPSAAPGVPFTPTSMLAEMRCHTAPYICCVQPRQAVKSCVFSSQGLISFTVFSEKQTQGMTTVLKLNFNITPQSFLVVYLTYGTSFCPLQHSSQYFSPNSLVCEYGGCTGADPCGGGCRRLSNYKLLKLIMS